MNASVIICLAYIDFSFFLLLTHTAAVIHKYNLFKKPSGSFIQYAVDATQQRRPCLIVETYDNTSHR